MLQRVGLPAIFTEDSNFSKMYKYDIFISSLEQDSHISINEDGIEAAAFTEAALIEAAAMEAGKAEMILNRPFLFGIQYGGIWLFIGICNNPAE